MAALLSSLVLSACSVFGIRTGTEEPHFVVVDHLGPVEIRRYDARVAAETTVDASEMAARSTGFRRLAGYIFGANAAKASIAMTAPVAQSAASGQRIAMTAPVDQVRDAGGGWVIRFLPAERHHRGRGTGAERSQGARPRRAAGDRGRAALLRLDRRSIGGRGAGPSVGETRRQQVEAGRDPDVLVLRPAPGPCRHCAATRRSLRSSRRLGRARGAREKADRRCSVGT